MTIAVAVLLFLITIVWLVIAFIDGLDVLSLLIGVAQGTLGVLQLALPLQGILITNGVLLCIWAVVGIALTIMAYVEELILGVGATLLTAWVLTFAVLQLTIVV